MHQSPDRSATRSQGSVRVAGLDRREFLFRSGGGFGAVALAHLLGESDLAAEGQSPGADLNGGLHHRAKARRVIQLFMNGGVSQMDTFDYKPELTRRHGEKIDFGLKAAVTSEAGAVMKSPFEFKQHGQCGRWVSSVFPEIAGHVDDLAVLMAMTAPTNVHGPASYLQSTGFQMPGYPSFGAWVSYGLGRIADDLPAFVVLPDSRGLPYNSTGDFGAGFLPAAHAGTVIRPTSANPVPFLNPPTGARGISAESERDGLAMLAEMNRRHAAEHPGDSRLDARITAFELAAKMQTRRPKRSIFARDRSHGAALWPRQ